MKKILILLIAILNILTAQAKEEKMLFYVTYNKREKDAKEIVDNFKLLNKEFRNDFLIEKIHQTEPCKPLKFKGVTQFCLNDDGTDMIIGK